MITDYYKNPNFHDYASKMFCLAFYANHIPALLKCKHDMRNVNVTIQKFTTIHLRNRKCNPQPTS